MVLELADFHINFIAVNSEIILKELALELIMVLKTDSSLILWKLFSLQFGELWACNSHDYWINDLHSGFMGVVVILFFIWRLWPLEMDSFWSKLLDFLDHFGSFCDLGLLWFFLCGTFFWVKCPWLKVFNAGWVI